MKLLKRITEDEMIAAFLRMEFTSERFGGAIQDELKKAHQPDTLVTEPDATSSKQNLARRQLLSDTRGYNQRIGIFEGFPSDVQWQEAIISKDELKRVKYTNYSYWVELTNGTRNPQEAAKNIVADKKIFNVSKEQFIKAAETFRAGHVFPPLILVGETTEHLVALEGHLRLAAYALAWDKVPPTLHVIVGLSPSMSNWSLF